MTACIVSGNVARPDSAMSLRRLRACGLIRAAPTLVCSSILGTGRWTAPACPETRWSETSAGWREAGVSVVGGLQCGGWDVAAVLVEAAVGEPVDPLGGGDLDVVDGLPWPSGLDQFGLVEAVLTRATGLSDPV